MKYTGTLSTNTSVEICDIVRRHDAGEWYGTVIVSGTVGGTVALQISPDAGVTKTTMLIDGTSSAATLAAAGVLNIRAGASAKNTDNPKLYATLSGSTTSSITITVFDNR